MLSAFGAVCSVFVAILVLQVLLVLAPPELPRVAGIGIDSRALAFTAGIALLAAVLFGTLPAFETARIEPAQALRAPDSTAAPGARRHFLRHGLVVAQVAITMLVLSTAGLLLKSFDHMQRLDVGFAARDVFLAEVAIPVSRYAEPADLQRAMVRLAEHAATLPGVGHATALSSRRLLGPVDDATVFAEGQPLGESTIRSNMRVDPVFCGAGLVVLRGRVIDERDRVGSEPVVAVNEALRACSARQGSDRPAD